MAIRRATATQTCHRCRHTFRVLEDEQGMHDCPRCGRDDDGQYECEVCGDRVDEVVQLSDTNGNDHVDVCRRCARLMPKGVEPPCV